MHELSIAQSVIDLAVKNCTASGHTAIEKITLSIGSASGVMPEALAFAFEVIKKDTIAGNAALCINNVPISGVCCECKKEFASYDRYFYIFNCPHCNSAALSLTGGFELDMVDIEVE
ncbi:MAG: hydrogenase maturation nickel metallochaperone HypA [Nitrospirae bacterium]|nr:hydrogenase maturation nickel metallochaperone HypA [Nitrospirota bacterium]